MSQHKRKLLFRANKFQQPIINLILFPSIPIYLVTFLYILYFYYLVTTDTIAPGQTFDIEVITTITASILAILWIFTGVMLIWVYRVSNRMVGAFERILKEMDDVIEGKGKKHIQARKGDTLAIELLQRVNSLIDKISD